MRSKILRGAVPALLAVLAASPALAAPAHSKAAGAALAKDDPAWLDQCVEQAEAEGDNDTFGWGRCMLAHREALEATQTALLARIDAHLASKGPPGTDYKAGAASLATAQRNWQAFVAADCGLIANVFGDGTAEGLAEEECVVLHARARNAQLRTFLDNYFGN